VTDAERVFFGTLPWVGVVVIVPRDDELLVVVENDAVAAEFPVGLVVATVGDRLVGYRQTRTQLVVPVVPGVVILVVVAPLSFRSGGRLTAPRPAEPTRPAPSVFRAVLRFVCRKFCPLSFIKNLYLKY
jgi:hypothetical protein